MHSENNVLWRLAKLQNKTAILSLKNFTVKTVSKDDSGYSTQLKQQKLEMWANAQHDGRPAEYR